MFEVTRNVVNDLWPLCQAQEASADSRALVDAFLAHDAAFAAQLKESAMQPQDLTALRLSPDAERRYLDDARAHARMKMGLILFGMIVGGYVLIMALRTAIVLTLR